MYIYDILCVYVCVRVCVYITSNTNINITAVVVNVF